MISKSTWPTHQAIKVIDIIGDTFGASKGVPYKVLPWKLWGWQQISYDVIHIASMMICPSNILCNWHSNIYYAPDIWIHLVCTDFSSTSLALDSASFDNFSKLSHLVMEMCMIQIGQGGLYIQKLLQPFHWKLLEGYLAMTIRIGEDG